MHGNLGKWLEEFLKNRTQNVLIDGIKSETTKVKSGSVQGSVLGQVLFIIYVSDITEKVTSDIQICVDDVKVKEKIENDEDVENLQTNLETLN